MRVDAKQFITNIGHLSFGTLVSNLMMVAITPIIARFYSPTDFGKFALLTSILAVVNVFSTLRYHLAIPLSKHSSSVIILRNLCYKLLGATSSLVFFSSLIYVIATGKYYFLFLSFGALTMGSNAIENNTLIYLKKFKVIAWSKIIQVIVLVICQLSLSIFYEIGLVLGHILGQGSSVFFQRKFVEKNPGKIVKMSELVGMANLHVGFPKYSVSDGLLNKVGVHMPIFLLNWAVGPSIAGLFAMADRLIQVPVSFLGSAIGQVFYSRADELSRPDKARTITSEVILNLFCLALPISVACFSYIPDLLVGILSDDWRGVGAYAQALLPWLTLVFVVSPTTGIFMVLGKQKALFSFQVVMIVLRLFALSFVFLDPLLGVRTYGFVGMLAWAGLMCVIFKMLGISLFSFLRKLQLLFVCLGIMIFISICFESLIGFLLNIGVCSLYFILKYGNYVRSFFTTIS